MVNQRAKRIAKTPKLHFLDSGILATARGLESFAFSEILKLMTASDLQLTPCHFRDQRMHEVDVVLERDDRMIVGIEAKAAATVKSSDFAGLRTLAEARKERFAYGVVLYDNTDFMPFGGLSGRIGAHPPASMRCARGGTSGVTPAATCLASASAWCSPRAMSMPNSARRPRMMLTNCVR